MAQRFTVETDSDTGVIFIQDHRGFGQGVGKFPSAAAAEYMAESWNRFEDEADHAQFTGYSNDPLADWNVGDLSEWTVQSEDEVVDALIAQVVDNDLYGYAEEPRDADELFYDACVIWEHIEASRSEAVRA